MGKIANPNSSLTESARAGYFFNLFLKERNKNRHLPQKPCPDKMDKPCSGMKPEFAHLFTNTGEAAMVSDMDNFSILEVNQAAMDLFGYTRAEFFKLTALDISADPEIVLNTNRNFKLGIIPASKFRFMLDSKGKRFCVQLTGGFKFQYKDRQLNYFSMSLVASPPPQFNAFDHGEQAFKAVIENSSDIIIVCDAEGLQRYIGPSVERILGYAPDEWLGQSQFDLHHPDTREIDRADFALLAQEGGSIKKFRWEVLHKDGQYRTMVAVASNQVGNPAINGIIINLRDVSESRLLEEKLRTSEAWFRAVVENIDDLILLLDRDGYPLFLSPSFFRYSGYHPAGFLSERKPMFAYLHPDDKEGTLNRFSEIIKTPGGTTSDEFRFLHADGSYHVFEMRAINNLDNDAVGAIICSVRDITTRKAAELQVESDLSMYRTVMESTAEGLVAIDNAGKILSYNRNFARMWHLPENTLQYRDQELAIGAALEHLQHPEKVADAIRHYTNHPEESGVMIVEFCDGTVLEAFTKPHILDGKIIGRIWSNRDITSRKQSEKAQLMRIRIYKLLSEVSRKFIAEPLDAAISFALNEVGTFSKASRGFVGRFNAEQTHFICIEEWTANLSIPKLNLFLEYTPNTAMPYGMAQLLAGNSIVNNSMDDVPPEAHVEKAFIASLNVAKAAIIVPIEYANRVIGFIGLDKIDNSNPWREEDLQALKLVAEIQANAMARSDAEFELRHAKEAAEAATIAKSEFLANMSHEIRTPMNAILGFSDLLQERIADPQILSYIQSISSSGKNLLSLINDILDLSKIEAGRLEISLEPVSIKALLSELQSVFYVRSTEKGLGFRVNIDSNLPDQLLLDEVRLRQILFNLVGNAIKFTEKGEISIVVAATESAEGLLNLVLEIKDTGIGINADELDLIFESFKQQSGQNNRKFGGTGLGLAITRRLVEMMGGSITVESRLGEGSLFKVMLNLIPVVMASQIDILPEKPNRKIIFKPAVVLLVDDIDLNRQLVHDYLQGENIRLLEANSGYQALEMARYHKPDLIILDIKMPGMDGFETIFELRKEISLHRIPVIALTAQAMKEDREKIEKHGFDGYLTKPVSSQMLLSEMMRFLPFDFVDNQDVFASQNPEFVNCENITGLIEILKTEGLASWEETRKRFIISRVQGFAQYLSLQADVYGSLSLKRYANELQKQAANFEMDLLPLTLAAFPDEIERLESIAKTSKTEQVFYEI